MYRHFSMIFRNSHRKKFISHWLFLTYNFKNDFSEIFDFNKIKYITVIDFKLEFHENL